jgi:hypothetical protein
MTKFEKRPLPRQVDGIGTWRAVMGFIVYSSIFINVGIYVLSLKGLSTWQDETKQSSGERALAAVVFLLLFERCCMLVMMVVHHLCPKVGKKVRGLLAQKGMQFKQHYLSTSHHLSTAHASAVPTEILRMHEEREQAAAAPPVQRRGSKSINTWRGSKTTRKRPSKTKLSTSQSVSKTSSKAAPMANSPFAGRFARGQNTSYN